MLSEIWDHDGQLDGFAAWLWTRAFDSYLPEPANFGERTRLDVDRDWLAILERRIDESQVPSPYQAARTRSISTLTLTALCEATGPSHPRPTSPKRPTGRP